MEIERWVLICIERHPRDKEGKVEDVILDQLKEHAVQGGLFLEEIGKKEKG